MNTLTRNVVGTVVVFLILGSCSNSFAATIFRDVTVITNQNQIIVGGFGSGVFFRPTFEIDPVALNVGDTIDLLIHFDRPIEVIADAQDMESVGAFVTAPNLRLTSEVGLFWQFLNVSGDLVSPVISTASNVGSGSGIGGQAIVNLTDTQFSFQGIHYALTLTSGTGFPAIVTEGAIAVQTQGSIVLVPEPNFAGLICLNTLLFVTCWTRIRRNAYPGAGAFTILP